MSPSVLVLASASPRRRELLTQIGVSHEVYPVDLDERRRAGEAPRDYVKRVAEDKARAGWTRFAASQGRPVLAADTAVVLGMRILGKPVDRAEALAMLRELSGRQHAVLTAVSLCDSNGVQTRLNESLVTFRNLSRAEAEQYCDTEEPMDKAGGYAVQGRAAVFIERIEGSYSGVMGLPLFETAELLAAAGIWTT